MTAEVCNLFFVRGCSDEEEPFPTDCTDEFCMVTYIQNNTHATNWQINHTQRKKLEKFSGETRNLDSF
jgi:hypothetical protein